MTDSMEELEAKDLVWQIAEKIMGFKNLEYRITDKGEILFGDVFTARGRMGKRRGSELPDLRSSNAFVVETNLNAISPDRAC